VRAPKAPLAEHGQNVAVGHAGDGHAVGLRPRLARIGGAQGLPLGQAIGDGRLGQVARARLARVALGGNGIVAHFDCDHRAPGRLACGGEAHRRIGAQPGPRVLAGVRDAAHRPGGGTVRGQAQRQAAHLGIADFDASGCRGPQAAQEGVGQIMLHGR
jgi:hypothetical protein